jgi:IclR family acetate operon transcriptional repressor
VTVEFGDLSPAMKNQSGVKSARRVLGVLELLSSRSEPMALHEIAGALQLPRSSAHGLMGTLVDTGFVSQHRDKRYGLSMKWLSLMSRTLASAERLNSTNLKEMASPVMLRLSATLKMTCNLAVLRGRDVLYIEKVDSGLSGLQIGTHVGAILPAYATALGKSLLAQFTTDRRDAWLEGDYVAITPKTKVTAADLREDLIETRTRGYAIDDEESHLGVVCIASAILGYGSEPLAAISVSGVKPAVEAIGIDAVGALLRGSAAEISSQLGAPNGFDPDGGQLDDGVVEPVGEGVL